MKFQRPVVPSRWFERICFGTGAFAIVAMGFYGFSAAQRALIDWQEVPVVFLEMSVGVVPVFAFGYFCRWKRLKRAAEMREYERVLAAGFEGS